jgi:hypothetical protein
LLGLPTGGLTVDANLSLMGTENYLTVLAQVYNLWQDPQARCNIFMNNCFNQFHYDHLIIYCSENNILIIPRSSCG